LCQRELAGIAGHDDEGQEDDPDGGRRRQRFDPTARSEHGDGQRRGGEQHGPRRAHHAAAEFGRLLEGVPAKRQRATADDQHDDDDEERDRIGSPLKQRRGPHLDLQVGDLGLEDADDQASHERQWERAEPADKGCGQGRHYQQGELEHLQPRDVHDEDGGRYGEGSAQRPVDRGDDVWRDTLGGSRPTALGDSAGGEAEPRCPVQEGKRRRHRQGDREDQQPVLAHHHVVEKREAVGGQQLVDQPGAMSPQLLAEGEADGEDAERGDQPRHRRGVAQRTHDQ
jgi:hypothetical protein